jgi:hypothetical protein
MEPRTLFACLLIVVIAATLGGAFLHLTWDARSERRLERMAERNRKARRGERLRREAEAGQTLGG